jgi:N-acetylglucosaminyl-diphospho-decaprenol L-rhamnosyltransferase
VLSVAAVVVSFEAREHLGRCLASLPEGVEVVVVDNASSDGSAELVRERFPHARLLALEQNVGFGAACNIGVDAVTADALLLLNPDTIVRRGAISELCACIEQRPDVALVAPTLLNVDGSVQLSILRYPGIFASGRPALTAFPAADRHPRADERDLVDEYPVGAAVLLRRRAFAGVGGFDPGFFHFYEELDLCKRLLVAGWKIRLCRRAEVEHVGGGSSTSRWSTAYTHQLRGHLRYVGKYRGRAAAELARALLVAALSVRLLYARGDQHRAYRTGLRWLLRADVGSVMSPRLSA